MPDRRSIPFVLEAVSWVVFIATVLFFLLVRDEAVIERWAKEDRLIEWATVVFMALVGVAAIHRARLFWQERPARIAMITLAVIAFVFLGEEISWGQRVFGWETPELFGDYNKQNETNFHNFHFGEFSFNRDLFGPAVEWSSFYYLCFFPFLIPLRWIRWFADTLRFPVPRPRHQIAYFVAYLYIFYICTFDRRWEGLELLHAATFFMIFVAAVGDAKRPLRPEDQSTPGHARP